jgi:hypothetical protein
MDHLITPKEKVLTPGEYHCCINGKTPTEYDSAPSSAFSESTVDNGDGTWTTTWVMDGTQTVLWQVLFTLCCGEELEVSVTDNNPAPEGGLLIYLNGSLFHEDYIPPLTVQVDEESGASDYFPIRVCGLNVMIEGQNLEFVNDTLTVTHGKTIA